MIDGQGRNIDYIRISVTDRCDSRCIYCMPEGGVPFLPHEEILSYEEILQIVTVLAKQGLRKIKLTGGEPLIRKNLPHLVRELKKIPGITSVTLTTNGKQLSPQLKELVEAGIDAINLSIDAVEEEPYATLTRRSGVDAVLSVMEECLAYPQLKVKLNVVPIAGENEEQLGKLCELARTRDLSVRFIELMPIGFGRQLECLGEDAIRQFIAPTTGELTPLHGHFGNGPCRYYQAEGFQGKIGFISAVSHQFCDSCNRMRLTADGYLKTCLQYDCGVSLKEILRSGGSEEELLQAVFAALAEKPLHHAFSDAESTSHLEQASMSQIGG